MLSFENICFLKLDNVNIFLMLLSREFHSLTADGIQVLVPLRGTEMFLLFSNG